MITEQYNSKVLRVGVGTTTTSNFQRLQQRTTYKWTRCLLKWLEWGSKEIKIIKFLYLTLLGELKMQSNFKLKEQVCPRRRKKRNVADRQNRFMLILMKLFKQRVIEILLLPNNSLLPSLGQPVMCFFKWHSALKDLSLISGEIISLFYVYGNCTNIGLTHLKE